jgi:hypothetical protein
MGTIYFKKIVSTYLRSIAPMSVFFDFEADFVDSLRCIPMSVRLKLDTCGVKVKLAEWSHFTKAECDRLVELPCERSAEIAAYREYLSQLIMRQTGHDPTLLAIDPAPAWLDRSSIPPSIVDKATQAGVELTLAQWQELSPLQRFALIKLTRSTHENHNFVPAMKEFGLVA